MQKRSLIMLSSPWTNCYHLRLKKKNVQLLFLFVCVCVECISLVLSSEEKEENVCKIKKKKLFSSHGITHDETKMAKHA